MKTYYFDRLSCSIKFNIRYFYRSLIRNLFFKVLKANSEMQKSLSRQEDDSLPKKEKIHQISKTVPMNPTLMRNVSTYPPYRKFSRRMKTICIFRFSGRTPRNIRFEEVKEREREKRRKKIQYFSLSL